MVNTGEDIFSAWELFAYPGLLHKDNSPYVIDGVTGILLTWLTSAFAAVILPHAKTTLHGKR